MSWIEQFTDMIFPLDRGELNIEGAYILKNQHLPSSIFKYREVNDNSIKNLEEDTIWLADPSNFNDPYDCAHTVDFTTIKKQSEPESFAKFMEERGSDIDLSDEQKRNLYKSKSPIDDLIDILLSGEPPERKEGMKAALTSVQKKCMKT